MSGVLIAAVVWSVLVLPVALVIGRVLCWADRLDATPARVRPAAGAALLRTARRIGDRVRRRQARLIGARGA
ncbi:hypothetical protein [Blastococcus sp. SYSU DS0973]